MRFEESMEIKNEVANLEEPELVMYIEAKSRYLREAYVNMTKLRRGVIGKKKTLDAAVELEKMAMAIEEAAQGLRGYAYRVGEEAIEKILESIDS